ncbi:hypothetical protein PR048_024135 [Dryococelus australis]|uniref:Uncharacterized protein n=1 Tax=Dryococelus australis TaxID=614101 RepID=A0ABQ9GW05_9NEOP|nr:hypothetical protein PR048_024135 [Dryococelus australis]
MGRKHLIAGGRNESASDFYKLFQEDRLSEFRAQLHANGMSLSDQSIATLFGLIDTEGSLSDVSAAFKIVTKRRGEAASLAKQAFHELEAVISQAEALGVTVSSCFHLPTLY